MCVVAERQFLHKGVTRCASTFPSPNDSLSIFKDVCSGNHIKPKLGEGKEALKQEYTTFVIQWQLAMSRRAPPKSIKNKLTHLSSFLRLLGTSAGTSVNLLQDPLTLIWGQQEGEVINRLKKGQLHGVRPRSCLAWYPVPDSRYLREGIRKRASINEAILVLFERGYLWLSSETNELKKSWK